jgi:hypothetical protein
MHASYIPWYTQAGIWVPLPRVLSEPLIPSTCLFQDIRKGEVVLRVPLRLALTDHEADAAQSVAVAYPVRECLAVPS